MAKQTKQRITRKKTTAPKTSKRTGATNIVAVTHDDIARRAYELFEARDYQHGSELDDWLTAETELWDH